MPTRSLNSSVFRWPDAEQVHREVTVWAARLAQSRRDVVRVGYFGSYAAGTWGVGSDVDLIVILTESDLPFESRAVDCDTTSLPVPADLLLYTEAEWLELERQEQPLWLNALEEAVWVFPSGR